MTKRDRRTPLDLYEAMLTEHGSRELLRAIEALMHELSVKLRPRKAPRARPAGRDRKKGATAVRQRRSAGGLDANATKRAHRPGTDRGGGGKARPAKHRRTAKREETT
ncbi:MAG TPA: hypothetical protein VEI03_03780 [Stellaceae bacterium]|nr:hypothetical protein [Stellaceae bacterium]